MAVTLVTVISVAVAEAEPMPNGIPGSWQLKVNDEFTGAGLNTALWTPGWQSDASISGPMSNNCVASKNVSQPGNGYIYLQVRKEHATCATTTVENTGGLIESNPSDGQPGHSGYAYTYGVVEWRAYVPGVAPTGRGCPKGGCLPDWPALWSHSNTNADEIDEMEGLETLGQACYHIHPPTNGPGACLSGSYAGWHTYAAKWEPGYVQFFYDGALIGQIISEELNGTPQYLIADMVPEGCCNQPRVVPDEMVVDYVRVWQHPPPPPPPTVSTSPASGVLEEQATLNGTLNGNGLSTKYHFEYGETTGYGSSTPTTEGGSGGSSPSSTVTKLLSGTTYHYRLVATSSAGTSYGADQGWTTLVSERNSTWTLRNPLTGDIWVYYVNSSAQIAEWAWDTVSWGGGAIGGSVAANTTPTVVRDPRNGDIFVYYVNSKNEIAEWGWNGSSWAGGAIGGSVKAGTSPSVVRNPATSYVAVYYNTSKGEIGSLAWTGSSWAAGALGSSGSVAAGSSPSVVYNPSTGNTWVYYVNSKTEIAEWGWNGSSWAGGAIGGSVKAETSPSVVRDNETGAIWVYYKNSKSEMAEWNWEGVSWHGGAL